MLWKWLRMKVITHESDYATIRINSLLWLKTTAMYVFLQASVWIELCTSSLNICILMVSFNIGSTCSIMALNLLYNSYKYSKDRGVIDSFPLQQALPSMHCPHWCPWPKFTSEHALLKLAEIHPSLVCGQQHDAHEFFSFLMENLSSASDTGT